MLLVIRIDNHSIYYTIWVSFFNIWIQVNQGKVKKITTKFAWMYLFGGKK